jgi:hypothetical protein
MVNVCSLKNLAPEVITAVPHRLQKNQTVAMALQDQRWPADIKGGLSMIGLFEYFQLWDMLYEMVLSQVVDQHIWRSDVSGQFSSKSAYCAFFNVAISFEPWHRLWKSWAPPKCKIFLWLAIQNRCWMTNGLSKRSLPHPLCDQADKDVQHLLTSCVFARLFWSRIFIPMGLQELVPW